MLFLRTILAALALSIFTGCTSHKAYLVARTDGAITVTTTNTLAIAPRPTPVEGDHELRRALVAELQKQGYQVLESTNADFTVAYWIEDQWRTMHAPPSASTSPLYNTPHFAPNSYGRLYPPNSSGPYYYYNYDAGDAVYPIASQGIHLQLYTRDDLRAGRLQRAWEGFIDAGIRATPESEPILLRTLIPYFGKDHVGNVRLAE